jgi:hypothetical protein
LGLFKFLKRGHNIVKDKQKGAVTEEYVYNIQIAADENIIRRQDIKMERKEKINNQSQGVEENDNPDNTDDFFCPAGGFEHRIIYKNRDIKKGYYLEDIIDGKQYIEKNINETAGHPFDEKIKEIADHGNKHKSQNMQKDRTLERIGVIFPEVIRIDQNNN